MLLNSRLQILLVECLIVHHWMVFLKTSPFVKQNNAEFTNVSSFTSLLMCSTHFTLYCRILRVSLPTSKHFSCLCILKSTEILPGSSRLGPPWCCLLLRQLKLIQAGLTSILDFWYPGPYYLMQEVLLLYFVCIECPVHKKIHWRAHNLADTVPLFDHFTVFHRNE
jgi:hypothetical protein